MRLDRRFLVVVAASLLWALLVAAAFYRLAGGGGRGARAAEAGKPLVVAAAPLPLGATLSRASVKLRSVPESLFPKGGFGRVEDVLERPVISAIQPDEPVLEARLAARGSGLGLAPLIPPGLRAVSVRVNDVVGVAGFVLPGMRVDVLVTGRPPNVSDTITRTVLQNITVLSAGQTIETDGKSQAIATPVVTLLVTLGEAESLTLASNEGHIQLVLRNSTDQQLTETRGRELHELYGPPRAVEAPPSPVAPPPPKPRRREAAAAARPAVEVLPATSARAAVGPPAPAGPAGGQVLLIRGNVKTVETAPGKGEAK